MEKNQLLADVTAHIWGRRSKNLTKLSFRSFQDLIKPLVRDINYCEGFPEGSRQITKKATQEMTNETFIFRNVVQQYMSYILSPVDGSLKVVYSDLPLPELRKIFNTFLDSQGELCVAVSGMSTSSLQYSIEMLEESNAVYGSALLLVNSYKEIERVIDDDFMHRFRSDDVDEAIAEAVWNNLGLKKSNGMSYSKFKQWTSTFSERMVLLYASKNIFQ